MTRKTPDPVTSEFPSESLKDIGTSIRHYTLILVGVTVFVIGSVLLLLEPWKL